MTHPHATFPIHRSDKLQLYLNLEKELPLVQDLDDEKEAELLAKLDAVWYALSDEEHEWLTARGNMGERKKCPKSGKARSFSNIVRFFICPGFSVLHIVVSIYET